MKVNLATQSFSKTVAAGVLTYTSLFALDAEAMVTGKFVERINNLFDSLKWPCPTTADPDNYKLAFTANSPHLAFWEEMYNEMQNWKFISSTNLTFPQNWQWTMRAVAYVWLDLQAEGQDHIDTGNINTDSLENFNSKSRQAGGNKRNPSPKVYPSAFATTLINDLTTTAKGKNNRDDNLLTFVITSLLQSAFYFYFHRCYIG